MKYVLKAIAIAAVIAAAACVILEYWDELSHIFGTLREKLMGLCKKYCGCSCKDDEIDLDDFMDDFAEVEE